ncbi:MAG: rod shape-determining protein MreD [Ignavibacteria bacterium]|nr:rod shape-determining protein MreD [Ignavibacteria bacterium]
MYLTTYLKYAGIFLVLIILQSSFIGYILSIPNYNITPDLVILLVIYLGYTRGQTAGMISGFISGLILDILSGTFVGLLALSYTLAGFIAGYFNRQLTENVSKKSSFLGIIFICTLVAYTVYYIIYFQGSGMNFPEIFIKHILTTALYTSVFGLIFAFINSRFNLNKSF